MKGVHSQSGALVQKSPNLNLLMKIAVLKIAQSMIPVFVIISFFSCSKDTDLLAEYLVSDLQETRFISNLVEDDYYFIANNKSIVLDVLSNDLFENPEKAKIIEISTPTNGTLIINENNTLTYTVETDSTVSEEIESSEKEQTPSQNLIPEKTEIPDQNEIIEEKTPPQEAETSYENETSNEKISTEDINTTQEKEEPINEKITYTVEIENKNGTTDSQEGTVTITNDNGRLKAFPSAEGYGKYTTGGRGGYVIHVTNLNDKGPGSLRNAVHAKGKRTIVFDVSGYIDLSGQISISNPDITIAGQTAPGNGITIRGASLSVITSNVIIRYLRIRPGSNAVSDSDCINIRAHSDNLNIDGVIIDHCSLSWSNDENLAFDSSSKKANNSIKNVTVQNCINAEALNHYAVLMGRKLSRISLIRNLFANNDNRIPESTYGYTLESYEFNNNIIYNYNRPTVLGFGVNVDVIGNIYKAKRTPPVPNLQYRKNNIENPEGEAKDGKVFQSDNIQIGTNPNGMTSRGWDDNNRSSRVLTDSPYTPIPAHNLEKTLLSDIGANVFNDVVDNRIIGEYKNYKGLGGPRNESQIGGYPSLAEIRNPIDYDSDRDGMADKWELGNGLDPKNSDDGKADKNGDGYTNLEDFLHYLTVK